MISDLELVPMINSIDQMLRHVEALPGAPFGIQLDGHEPAGDGARRMGGGARHRLEQEPDLLISAPGLFRRPPATR